MTKLPDNPQTRKLKETIEDFRRYVHEQLLKENWSSFESQGVYKVETPKDVADETNI